MPAPPDPPPDAATDGEHGGRSTSGRRRKRRSWARRRHLGLITTGVALLVLLAGVVLVVATWDTGRVPVSRQAAALVSGTTTAVTTPSTAAPPATSVAPTASSAPGAVAVRATITAIGDSRWTADSATGLTYTVVVTPETTFQRNRDFASIAVGDVIAVKGTVDAGVITASSVLVAR